MKKLISITEHDWSANLWFRVRALVGKLDTRVTALAVAAARGNDRSRR